MQCKSRPPEPRSGKKVNFLKPGEESDEEKNHILWYLLSHLLNNRDQDEVRKGIKQHTG